MNEFLMMNIFFVIAAVGFVVFIVLLGIGMFYLIRLIQTIERIAATVEEEALALKGDLDAARAGLKNGGLGLLSLFGFAGKAGTRLLKKKKRSS